MPKITILGQEIDFPNSGTDPNWAPSVIEFAQLVEQALNAGFVGAYDVAPQSMNIDAYNPGTNVQINQLFFPVSEVQSVTIRYSVRRTTSLEDKTEGGTIRFVYNNANPIGNKWSNTSEYDGEANISFNITDTGQVRFSTEALSGTGHVGTIFFLAQSTLVD